MRAICNMFGYSTRFLCLCLLASFLSIIGLDDAKKVHGASPQLTKRISKRIYGYSDGLTTKSSITKRITNTLAQSLEQHASSPATETKSSIKKSLPAKVFAEGNEKESGENGNAKKKKKKSFHENQSTIMNGKNSTSRDNKKSQKPVFSLPTDQLSRLVKSTKNIDSNHSSLDSKWSSISRRGPLQRISNQSIEFTRTPKQVTIWKLQNNFALSKSPLRGQEIKGPLDKMNWTQRRKSNGNAGMEHDSLASVISKSGGDSFNFKDETNDVHSNKNGHWRIIESKTILLSYPGVRQKEKTISSIIGNPLSSKPALFEQKAKLEKIKDGVVTHATETPILKSTAKTQRKVPQQLDINNLIDHIRQHIYGNIGYPIHLWPWHMSVQQANLKGWQHLCYGAVVSRYSVLTNAECVYRKPLPSLRIVRHNIIDKMITLNNSSYIVARVIHPEYKRYLERLHRYGQIGASHDHLDGSVYGHHIRRNNLALLQMQHQFGVNPIHLDNDDHTHRYKMCYTVDHRPVQLISNRECSYYFGAEHIGRSHVCAYGLPCDIHHHHGSPLVCSQPGHRPYLVGLSSYQQGCGDHRPTVYERIAPYNSWITRNLK